MSENTDLRTFLAESGKTATAFAEEAGTTTATISRIAAGKFRPSIDLAHRIEQATGGRVPIETWVRAA